MSFEVLPVFFGLAAVITVAVAAHFYFSKSSKDGKKKKLITLLDPTKKYLLPLIEKEEISHDTKRFRFGLPSAEHVLGLPIGQHIHLIATINEENIIRAYTPVSSDENKGYVDLVIKVYASGVHPKFPNGGKMSQYVDSLKIGDTIAFRGPTGKLQYLGDGIFNIRKPNKPTVDMKAEYINMIAGGTGITPMLQLVREILTRAKETRYKLALLFANQSENDILLRNELDSLAAEYPDHFKVWYTVDTASDKWTYSTGFVNADMIRDHLYPASDSTVVLMCGPPPMINYACIPNLDTLEYNADLRFAY
ncbi:NADH-cytochrome b5 reductase 2 isoform X2 [Contarinia nasturtii]|uniref:NADH-cytochrome b5 reductase 2 isoform X2 n=1 Tax=Contarinia nasturtii TaxID=265458 RepID=UPI0012D3907A|nr:NADH-cytochrome b5 reductase 2 isoform X2 [Contarinia nasturtii]